MRSLESVVNEVFCDISHSVTLELRWKEGAVLVAHIATDPQQRGRGFATKALTRVCEIADQEEWRLTLQTSDGFGSDKGRLARWYYRHGFIPAGQPELVSQIRWMSRAPQLYAASSRN